MEKAYQLEGMTCGNCEKSVQDSLLKLPEIESAIANKDEKKVTIESSMEVSLETLQKALPIKYHISHLMVANEPMEKEESKWKQLQPLFLILFYISITSLLLNIQHWSWMNFMLDFMGIFLITFSFFKFLDYGGFPESFAMYDPLAKQWKAYGWLYPFIETALGLAFLFRFQLKWTLLITLLVLGITTIGVTHSLLNRSKIRCACLGTALKLPMTEATFIENAIMIVMIVATLIQLL